MTTSGSTPLPPGDRRRFTDPAADPVYAAIKSLDPASQQEMLQRLQEMLHAEDVSTYATEKARVAHALEALNDAKRELGHSPSVEEYRKLYRGGGRDADWHDDRCIRRWLGGASWNDALRRAHLEPLADGDVVVFQHGHFYLADEVTAALRECAGDLAHVPTYPEYIAWVNRPDVRRRAGRRPKSYAVFGRLFGDYVNALRAAELISGDPEHAVISAAGVRRSEYRVSDESLKKGLREVAARLGRSPRVAEYLRERALIYEETLAERKPRTIASYGTLNRRFGGEWDSVLAWAGLEPLGGRGTSRFPRPKSAKGPRVTKDVIKQAIRAAYEEEGDPFTVHAYMIWREEQLAGRGRWEREKYPSYHTIWSRYGSWDEACEAALWEDGPEGDDDGPGGGDGIDEDDGDDDGGDEGSGGGGGAAAPIPPRPRGPISPAPLRTETIELDAA
jgi:hypothetical protein